MLNDKTVQIPNNPYKYNYYLNNPTRVRDYINMLGARVIEIVKSGGGVNKILSKCNPSYSFNVSSYSNIYFVD